MAKESENKNQVNEQLGVTRRGFLKGAGLTAAGAVILDGGLLGAKEARAALASAPKVIGPGSVPVTLRVNNSVRRIAVKPRTTLARRHAGLLLHDAGRSDLAPSLSSAG